MPKKGENIYKRKDGRWEGRYRKGHTSTGKTIYGYVYARTYREVKNKLLLARNSDKPEKGRADYKQISELAEEWLAFYKCQLKESTYNKYSNLVHSYICPNIGNIPIGYFTNTELDFFCKYLFEKGGKQGNGLSSKTISDTVSVIRGICDFAVKQGYTQFKNPIKSTIKQQQQELRVLSTWEQERLCTYLTSHMNRRNLGILLCLFTGLRLGELCALTWEDISLEEQVIHVHRTMQRVQMRESVQKKTKVIVTSPKSRCSIRSIPLQKEIVSYLSAYQNTGYLLSGSKTVFVEPRTMQNHFKRVIFDSGIEDANFHSLRHSFATRCIEIGFDIKSLSEILGHSSVNITMNRYVHPSIELKREQMQRLSSLITVK